MATELKNLSSYNPQELPDARNMKFGIVVAEWNSEITEALFDGAYKALIDSGVPEKNIIRMNVPGSFELTFGSKLMLETTDVDAVIALGAIIRGQTPHFDFISQGVTFGLTELNLKYSKPVIFGVLTTNNLEQARDRAGGKFGNKGTEAAITAIKMADLARLR